MQYDNFQEALNAILDAPADDGQNGKNRNRDYFEDHYISALETYTEFLDQLPAGAYEEVAVSLLQLILKHRDGFMYQMQERQKEINEMRREIAVTLGKEKPKKEKSPSLKINDHLKKARQARQLLYELFDLGDAQEQEPVLLNPPKGLGESLELLNNIIEDLQGQTFKVVSEHRYYEYKVPSKTPIKEYLDSIIKKYSLKSATLSAKQLVDNL
jgi:hypothetical protein